MSTELQTVNQNQGIQAFSSQESFQLATQMANALSSSEIVPENYRGKPANCLIALEMSNRIGVSVMAVMQNLNIIQGKPSWSSTFIIASINSCGRFIPLEFEISPLGPKTVNFTDKYNNQNYNINDFSCRAVSKSTSTGTILNGPWVTVEMAVKEGWYSKKGSKWVTMPELMLQYRAASFFGRLYCPDVIMGMHSEDEIRDIQPQTPAGTVTVEVSETDTDRALVYLRAAISMADLQYRFSQIPPVLRNVPEVTQLKDELKTKFSTPNEVV